MGFQDLVDHLGLHDYSQNQRYECPCGTRKPAWATWTSERVRLAQAAKATRAPSAPPPPQSATVANGSQSLQTPHRAVRPIADGVGQHRYKTESDRHTPARTSKVLR